MNKILAALALILPLSTACTSVIDGGSAGLTGIATSDGTNVAPGGASGGVHSSAGGVSGSSAPPTPIDPSANGLPCDVTAVLQHYCSGCHSSPPTGGAPQALTAYDNLIATATTDPTQKIGPLSVALMKSGVMPPKPEVAPTAAEQATLANWVAAGMPKATCAVVVDAGVVASPYDTPLKCTSMKNWTRGDNGSAAMHPGGACVSCHTKYSESPTYTIAGTVYPSAHEPDDCNGASAGLSVLITEATGTTHTLAVNSAGNFFYEGSIAMPYAAQVNSGSSTRVMTHKQTSGDCNACHTVNGASTTPGAANAPGRIMSP